ncbi:MAG: extradiol dioxygenase [bacterium]
MPIIGMHAIMYSRQADAIREFLRDTLGWSSVDAGRGWLIFAAPPTEVAVHPTDGPAHHDLYLMCVNLEATIAELSAKGVSAGPITTQSWGRLTTLQLPSGEPLGLYEPHHPLAIPVD